MIFAEHWTPMVNDNKFQIQCLSFTTQAIANIVDHPLPSLQQKALPKALDFKCRKSIQKIEIRKLGPLFIII